MTSSSTTKTSAATGSASKLAVVTLDDEGRGVGPLGDVMVHVPGALPGELVDVTIEHRSPHRPQAFARLRSVLHPSPSRVAPVCPATGRCGGCPLGMLDYEVQLTTKHDRAAGLLATVPGAPPLAGIVRSPRAVGYRGQAKLVYGYPRADAAPCLGAYAPRSHQIVDLAGCRVVEPVLDEVRRAVLSELTKRGVEPHDERTGTGTLAYVVLRANAAGEVLATFVGPDLDALAPLASLLGAHPALVGVAANLRPQGNAIFGRTTRTLAGKSEIVERVGGIELRLSPTAFFQVNRDIATALYAEVAERMRDAAGLVVDAYAGVGGIALTLSRAGAEVLGIEVNADAVREATSAAHTLGLPARFVVADAAAGLREVASVDALVVNPPRRGLDRAMLDVIADKQPRQVAYVSCDPATLTRDLRILVEQGLRITHVRAFDMHPQTAHIETLAILER